MQERISEIKGLVQKLKSKARNPNYPESVKELIVDLSASKTILEISDELGVSSSFVKDVMKRRSQVKAREKKSSRPKTPPIPLQFLQISNEVPNLQKKTPNSTPFMKATLPNGVTIEIWGPSC